VERAWAVAVADGDDRPDTGLASAGNHLLAIGVELTAFQMRVRIDVHKREGELRASSPVLVVRARTPVPPIFTTFYFRRAPIGTSSRKLHSTGLPPSGEAATIMPFDSNPRSLR